MMNIIHLRKSLKMFKMKKRMRNWSNLIFKNKRTNMQTILIVNKNKYLKNYLLINFYILDDRKVKNERRKEKEVRR
jgi:hypothetical protein